MPVLNAHDVCASVGTFTCSRVAQIITQAELACMPGPILAQRAQCETGTSAGTHVASWRGPVGSCVACVVSRRVRVGRRRPARPISALSLFPTVSCHRRPP